jgi:hypothetical protein
LPNPILEFTSGEIIYKAKYNKKVPIPTSVVLNFEIKKEGINIKTIKKIYIL